ncbi:hypothetical protein FALCPG4_018165 [Fusarium falciforme]
MPAHKRKLSLHPKPEPHHLRSSSRSRKIRYDVDSDSDSEKKHEPTPVTSQSRPSHAQQHARAEDSGDEYVDASEEDDEDDEDDENDHPKQKNHQQKESHGELDEDEPPRVTIIPLERLREAGDIEYVDFRIHPNSLLFLTDLKENNNRTWLKGNHAVTGYAFRMLTL